MRDWHKIFPGSGVGKQMPQLLEYIQQYELQDKRLLDFGCGGGGTIRWLQGMYPEMTVLGWDIGTEQYSERPGDRDFDAIYSIDCLEHIEREHLPHTMENLRQMSHQDTVWCHIIDMTPAKKRLPDGRNAHVTLMTATEWQSAFESWGCEVTQIRVFDQPDPNYTVRSRCEIHCRP